MNWIRKHWDQNYASQAEAKILETVSLQKLDVPYFYSYVP
jgi:hypothetical protein